jgi:lipopolysaccharide export system protein LptA
MIDRTVLVMLLLVTAPAWALKTDRAQEMTINADQSRAEGDRVEFTGNVKIDQGSLKIRAAHAVVDQKGGEIERVVFDGSPATLQQEIENQGLMNAAATTIDYLLSEDKVVLSGDVRIQQPRGTMRSERVVYHVKTGLIDAGNQTGGVTMTIKPKTATQVAPAKN